MFSINVLQHHDMSCANRAVSLQCIQELVKIFNFRVRHRWCSRVYNNLSRNSFDYSRIALVMVVLSPVLEYTGETRLCLDNSCHAGSKRLHYNMTLFPFYSQLICSQQSNYTDDSLGKLGNE